MAQELSIRRFEPQDADAVWDVHEAAFRASPLAFVEEAAVDEDVTGIESHYLEKGGEFLVGEVDDSAGRANDTGIVAIGGFLPRNEKTVEIRRMRVDPEYQRRGFAGALLAALERRARAAGFDVAELETVEPLQAAQAFYEDRGYEVVEETTHPETGVAKYRYRKSL